MMSIKLKQTVLQIITKIQPDVVKKSEAKRANDDEVIAKKAKLIKIKKQLKKKKMQTKAKVDEEATKAKQSIDNATTNEAVDQAKTQGVTTITAIQPDTIKRQKRNAQLTKSLKLRNKKLIITQMQQKKKKM